MSDKAEKNLDIQNHPEKQNPSLPVEAQMEKAGEPEPIKDQYADSPNPGGIVNSTHDRDSVQPPTPRTPAAPPMPLKSDSNKE